MLLDASALLAWLFGEEGAGHVQTEMRDALASSVNLAESLRVADRLGFDIDETRRLILEAGTRIIEFTPDDAVRSARIKGIAAAKRVALSLGDCCCLATALRIQTPVLTADRAWASLSVGVDIRLVR